MGYTVQTDAQGQRYAQLVKIDAGTAFSFLEGDAGIYAHDPRKRNMFFGLQATFILRYDQLSDSDKIEFAQTARQILQVPQATFKAIIDQGVTPEGFTQKQADRIVQELIARKSTFLNGFAPEVSTQLRAEVQTARQALLADLAAPAASPVVVHMQTSSVQRANAQTQQSASEHKVTASSALQTYDAQQSALTALQAQLEKERIQGAAAEEKTAGCQVFQKPMVSPHFVGREETLASLAQALHVGHGNVITQGISGLGGVGKTQLAARYVELASEGAQCGTLTLQYQAVIWLNAEYNLDMQFIMLAEAWCKKPGLKPEEAVAAVYHYLKNKRTLLVFDNAVDKASIEPYLPPSRSTLLDRFTSTSSSNLSKHFHILITSRNAEWPQIPTLSLSGFTQQEATDFIRQRLPNAISEEITVLVETVSTLPLALSHAVAYIAEGHGSLQDYPRQFALHQLSLGSSITIQTDATQTVLSTFLLSLFRIKQQYPIVELILNVCAYLAPEGILITWLEMVFTSAKEIKEPYRLGQFPLADVQRGLTALQRHALLQASEIGLLNIHRLLQQVIRHQLTPAEQQAQVTRVLQWLTDTNPQEGRNDKDAN